MKKTAVRLVIIGLVVWLVGCDSDTEDSRREAETLTDPPPISDSLQTELEAWLAEHGRPPGVYMIELFEDHDVVLLGEQHRIRHDALFVQDLLPAIHAAGVRIFTTEFGRRIDQAFIDSLIFADEWDEALGREILFRQFVPWSYREYVDILKTAWRVNRERSADSPPLRVLGMNNVMDYSQFQSEADREDPEVWQRVMGGQSEADWAAVVLAAVEKGQKVLVHCGIHHAFTKFHQPRVANGAFVEYGRQRLGNHLYTALGDRVVTVYLHAPWNSARGYDATFVHPADGRLDAFMLVCDGGPFPVAFDIAASPLAKLPIENAVYKHGHEPFTMAKFCDGWIYTKPIGEYEMVAFIEDWITSENLERARANSMNPRWRTLSAEQLNEGCKSYQDDFRRFFGHLR